MAIAKITKAYIREYSDKGQMTAYVEWLDKRGKTGRTEGSCTRIGDRYLHASEHIAALLNRAEREGVPIERQTW